MHSLLHIDSSPSGDASISRRLTSEFVHGWTQAHPDGKLITRDLVGGDLPAVTPEWIAGAYTPTEARTPAQVEALACSNTLIGELESAGEYVFGVPMYNFAAPAVFKLWIDQVVQFGRTFTYVDGKPVGLLKDKRATFLVASGGVYDAGTAMASLNFVEPYLRAVFGFIGVTETSFLHAGGTAALLYGKVDLNTFLHPHLEAIRASFQNR